MKQLKISFLIFFLMSVLTGIIYPFFITGIAGFLFPVKANGSMIAADNRIICSELIGQPFSAARYFHGRASSSNYDGLNSGGSNYGPTNKKFVDEVKARADAVRKENGLSSDAKVPSDLVLASGSGLDPHISIESAFFQIPRIARERKIDELKVAALINKLCEKQYIFFGKSFVNVLRLNMALDSQGEIK